MGSSSAPAGALRGKGAKKTPRRAPPSREKIVTSQSAHRPSSRTWVHRPKTTLSVPLILSLFPMTAAAPLLPYLERLLDGETVEWKTLGEICEKVCSCGTPLTSHSKYYEGNIPYLSSV